MGEGDGRRVAQTLPGYTEASPGLLWDKCRKEEDRMHQLMTNVAKDCSEYLAVLDAHSS